MESTSKEEFILILDRQQKRGVTRKQKCSENGNVPEITALLFPVYNYWP